MVPMEEVVEVRRGQKVNAERKFFPGYVLVKMEMTDDTWRLVKNTPKVTGFLGGRGRPTPIADAGPRASCIRCKKELNVRPSITFEIGEQVRVSDGPASFSGLVEEVDEARARLVAVSIFGRPLRSSWSTRKSKRCGTSEAEVSFPASSHQRER